MCCGSQCLRDRRHCFDDLATDGITCEFDRHAARQLLGGLVEGRADDARETTQPACRSTGDDVLFEQSDGTACARSLPHERRAGVTAQADDGARALGVDQLSSRSPGRPVTSDEPPRMTCQFARWFHRETASLELMATENRLLKCSFGTDEQ